MKFTRELLSSKNEKGIAIMMAIFSIILIVYIVTEVSYETTVEYAVHAPSISRVKAYYAARAGIEMSLYRIKLYKKVQAQFGKQLGAHAGLLNMVWSFPLMWPPIMPDGSTAVDKDSMKEKADLSKMDATYTTTISDEGSKIDINDLDSPSKSMRDITKKMIMAIFEAKMKDSEWKNAHENFIPEKLVNNIIDFMDADKQALNGGDERSQYPQVKEIVDWYPPNRSFRTLDELHLVAGMKDDYFNLLAPEITIYGAKAINPNTTSAEVLKSFDISMTDVVVQEVLTRRDDPNKGGNFTSAQDFWNFVNSKGGRVTEDVQKGIPLTFGAVTNFRVRSIGEYHGAVREIEVVVFDLDAAASSVAGMVKKDTPTTGGPTPTPTPNAPAGGAPASPGNQTTASKGPPRIVYWYEK